MIVIKFGGHAMGENSQAWMNEIANQFKSGEKFVIVHGGGPHIDAELKVRGIEKKSVNGFRITTPEVMHVVEMVLQEPYFALWFARYEQQGCQLWELQEVMMDCSK